MTSFRTSLYPSVMRNSGHHTRAFVLQLDPGIDPGAGRFEGRVEHVATGRAARFASPGDLLAFVALALTKPQSPDDEPPA
jgi:hypothetical protein